MRQFDVLRNPGRQREAVPYVVVLQSSRFDRAATRFVAPLILARQADVREHYLAPRFLIEGREVVMDVFNLATVPTERLGTPIATLADEDSRAKLVRALDELVGPRSVVPVARS